MPQFNKEQDPLGFLTFMAESYSIRALVPISDYLGSMARIREKLDVLDSYYDVMMGNENMITDDKLEIVIYVENEDAIAVATQAIRDENPVEETDEETVEESNDGD